ncbi:pyridoxal 5'-phosphate synthase glutaminase subunit PdxT [Corticibacter populi]|uniref:glutaminase n=1 Tax=Corticibacter populi TaxID=1550736 RepID=A0A3M6QPE7_9BURK|nr:pyridoxal 5'-phosphate synthase glutaminase subunit PdxT [Corticibacter populi]RMX04916.1 pyridoxal 5'-phosphate synthase glutaminase subunit PdxT [Corticibacter populi]RZS33659.1 pyridoxal phosphate synthase yaaE subunit [Corticibacter populi]
MAAATNPTTGAGTGITIGVLALQGAYTAHQRMLHDMGVATRQVRLPQDLQGLDALVLPGGESTTLLHFLQQGDFWPALKDFAATHPCLGTCAGLILLAQHVQPDQPSLGLLDVTVQRNAYGRQRDSYIHIGPSELPGGLLEMVFIRAPRIVQWQPEAQVLAWAGGSPVLVRQGRVIGCAFHPELGSDTRVHQLLVDACLTP